MNVSWCIDIVTSLIDIRRFGVFICLSQNKYYYHETISIHNN